MSAGDCPDLAYEDALDALSSLSTWRKGCGFHFMFGYLKVLELDGPVSELKVIHVAGTKGKGSTCAFAESILRNCGFRTGLLTSPHLVDVRERICLDGAEISKDSFLAYFWWCWNKLKEKTDEDLPMPNYFHFLTLLSFKIFTAEKVDVAILEVGLGGKLDSTNVVQQPIVCGISSLGYDHMEILGHTLGEIARIKAGIFKHGVPVFTVAQPDEAMSVLKDKASQLSVPLEVSQPLDASLLNGLTLGLDGDHQYLNAGLAVELCRTWLWKTGYFEDVQLKQTSLPVEFCRGLATAKLQGRAQIVGDPYFSMESSNNVGGLVFFLDGAHTQESMEACAKWFSRSVKKDRRQYIFSSKHLHDDEKRKHLQRKFSDGFNVELPNEKDSMQILLFHCSIERDPMLLLSSLVETCSNGGIFFHKAIFVPSVPLFNRVGSHSLPADDPHVDLSWQRSIQQAWEKTVHGDRGERMEYTETYAKVGENSTVFKSLPLALKWLRDTASKSSSTCFQVLVTGSLSLVGDTLKMLKT